MKKIMLLALLPFILFSGCKKSAGKKSVQPQKISASEKKPLVGFSIDTLAIERWQRDMDIFMARARDCGADVIVQNAGNSVDAQKKQLMYLLDKNVDVVVVLPKVANSLGEEIEKIRAKNIPVIAYDRLILDTEIDLYITVDTEQVGVIMGTELQKIAPCRNWLCILGPQEDNNMSMLLKGLVSTIKNPMSVITEIFYTQGWNYDLSRQKMLDVITSGAVPDAVVCGNDAVADSVITVLRTYCPNRHIPICGQDADIVACQNIVRRLQDFTVYKPIVELAETAAEISVKAARGENLQPFLRELKTINNGTAKIPSVLLAPSLVKKDNIDDVIISSGFHTYGEVYME
ncbi:sugar ABC transporter substrate-binding protein [Treponema sp.]|uniref:sugar ABC transporter substrate-binding protein n=1 Tax=Treponema sp. TaxID=166 RepID=UPI003F0BA044